MKIDILDNSNGTLVHYLERPGFFSEQYLQKIIIQLNQSFTVLTLGYFFTLSLFASPKSFCLISITLTHLRVYL